MSIYRPENLRYAKLDAVEEERALMYNYYQDIINAYGIDVTYYRRDTNILEDSPTSTMIYGHKNLPTYSKKTNLRSFVEMNDYNFILNAEGFIPSDKFTMYFGLNDFAACFADTEGKLQNYKIEETSGYGYAHEGVLTVPFSSAVITGYASFNVTLGLKENDISDILITDTSVPCYSVMYNPYIRKSFQTDCRNGHYSINLSANYDATKTNRIKYSFHGDVLYSNFFQNERFMTEIHPNPGDVVEIDYHTDDGVKEQYEITEVLSRKPTNQEGLSPFLGKYVWRCTAVRRISSHEDIPDEEATKAKHDTINEYIKKRSDAIEQTHDWSSKNATTEDDVYGGYDQPAAYKTNKTLSTSGSIDEIFDYDQYAKDWNGSEVMPSDQLYYMADFTDGSRLYTDGWNLYWEHKDGKDTNLTNIEEDETPHEDIKTIPVKMYMRVTKGLLVFYTATNYMKQLTHFTKTVDDGFDYAEGFAYKDVGYVNNDGYYIFKNSKIAINSFNDSKLVVFSYHDNSEYVLAEYPEPESEPEEAGE